MAFSMAPSVASSAAPSAASSAATASFGTTTTSWDTPDFTLSPPPDWSAWYYALGGTALVLLLLFVLAVLYRRGLIFQGAAWKRRPSHAQPWRHWGEAHSRMPSLFDLLHVPQRRKSAGVSLPTAETAFSESRPQGDPTVRAHMEPSPGQNVSTIAVPQRSLEAQEAQLFDRPASPPLLHPPTLGQPMQSIRE